MGLKKLKKVLSGKKDNENYFQWFDNIADVLFNKVALVSDGDKKYRLGEIEFYYHSIDHEDVFSHKHEYQKTNGRLYLHGSGMDITFGNKAKDAHGGILIRALIDSAGQLFYGPINARCELVLPAMKEHQVLQSHKWDKLEFYRSPRVGLKFDKKNPNDENAQKFIMMPYRYTLKKLITLKGYPGNYDIKKVMQIWNKLIDSDGNHQAWGQIYAQDIKKKKYIETYNEWIKQYSEETRQTLQNNSNSEQQ